MLCALAALWTCTLVNVAGLREAGRLQVALTTLKLLPLLLFGRSFWESVIDWQALADAGTISPEDLSLFRYVETAQEAVAIIDAFNPDAA